MTGPSACDQSSPIGSDGVLDAFPAKRQELESYFSTLVISQDKEKNRAYLIPALRRAQDIYTFLPESVQLYVANRLGLHLAEIYGVISFYAYFTTVEPGKNRISICCGTACHVKGASVIWDAVARAVNLKAGQHTTDDKIFTIERVSCVGACGIAPVVLVNHEVYGQATAEQISKIAAEIKAAATN